MNIALVTTAYNLPMSTQRLIDSARLTKYDLEIHLFLHSRHDGTVQMCELLAKSSDVVYYPYGTNRGLSKSWNEGILNGYGNGADIVVVVNDDLYFSDGDLDKIAEKAIAYREGYIISCAGQNDAHGKRIPSQGYSCFAFNPIALETLGMFDENIFPIYCLSPDTPILTADLEWIPIGDAVVGMQVIGVDEGNTSPQARRYRTATITAVTRRIAHSVRIVFTDGREVICSKDHRWLGRKPPITSGKVQHWVHAKDLYVGYRIVAPLRTWETETSYDVGWLSGMYDGEGSLHVRPEKGSYGVTLSQKPGIVMEQAEQVLMEMDIPFTSSVSKSSGVINLEVNVRSKVFELLGRVRPMRLLSKHSWDGVTIRSKDVERFAVIEHIEDVGEVELIDISTTTRTFIANGLISHNCEDSDYAYRAGLAGLHEGNCPDTNVYHAGSSAINADPRLHEQNRMTHNRNLIYYRQKWGGVNEQEIFKYPFNNQKFSYYIAPENRHAPYPGYNRHDQHIVKI